MFSRPDLTRLFYVSSIDETRGVNATLHAPPASPCSSKAAARAPPESEPAGHLVATAGIFMGSLPVNPVVLASTSSFISCVGLYRAGFKGGERRAMGNILGWVTIKHARRRVLRSFPAVGIVGFCGCPAFLPAWLLQSCLQPGPPSNLGRVQASSSAHRSNGTNHCEMNYLHAKIWLSPVKSLQFNCWPSPARCCCSDPSVLCLWGVFRSTREKSHQRTIKIQLKTST